MPEGNFGPIKFGPGGQVPVENEELIAKIKDAPSLPLSTVFKLSSSYQKYSSNEPLGRHLAWFVLFKLLQLPEIKAALDAVVPVGITLKEIFDQVEDGGDFTSNDEKQEDPGVLFIKVVSDGIVNLLVEAVQMEGQDQVLYYAIGIVPDLNQDPAPLEDPTHQK